MRVTVRREAGYLEAMEGLADSWNQDVKNMPIVAQRNAGRGGGHDKFLESLIVWVRIRVTRACWQQLDTYRVGVSPAANSAQSESTMHTILRHPLTQDHFLSPIWPPLLDRLNDLISRKESYQLKIELPEGFLQTRSLTTNYQTIGRLIQQRRSHRWPEWKILVDSFMRQLEHPELLEWALLG